ncbi:MAG: hypothetical protein ISS48_02235 [Candidatus Aenigmarchaeota archaeon]|nr:hypothetical protein [Candidatus Aenigmarchaeota archaeon]
MKLSKEMSLIYIGFLLVLSLVFLSYPFIFKKSGVVVVSVSENSSCKEILIPGSTITEINEIVIEDSSVFYSTAQNLEGRINLMINDWPRICTIGGGERIDAKVKDFEKEGIKFGIDIKGGKEFVVESEGIDSDLSAIESRIRNYELMSVKSKRVSDNSFSVSFDLNDEDKILSVLEPGVVSVKFLKTIEIKNNTGKFILDEKSYNLTINDGVRINDDNYNIGDKFTLDGIEIEVQNVTENYTSFFLNVFDDRDVDASNIGLNSRISQGQGVFQYALFLDLFEQAGKNFERVTKGQPVIINPQGENILQDPLVVFVDNKIVTSIPIVQSDVGKDIDQIVLWGTENTREDANRKLQMLTVFLGSGRLSDIEIVERWDIEAERKGLVNLVGYVVLGVIIASCAYCFVRHKDVKVVGLILGVFVTEILLFLGVLSSQPFSMILLICCVIFASIRCKVKGWMKWVGIVLMVIMSFGAVANKLVADSYTLIGFAVGVLLSAVQLVLLKPGRKEEKSFKNLWKISLGVLVILAGLFLVQDYKNVAIASTVVLMVSLSLTKPEYARLVKKVKGD